VQRFVLFKKGGQTTADNNIVTTYDDNDPNFERKLDLITAGVRPFVKGHLLTKISRENCKIIVNYVMAFLTEVSLAETYLIL
jgi:hypothetical protein